MNQATASTIAAALITQSIDAHAYPIDAAFTNWKVDARSDVGVDIAVVNTFITNHAGISGKATSVTLS